MKAIELSIDFGMAREIPLYANVVSHDDDELISRIMNADNKVGIGVCASCPLLVVCSDECGMNDANGYRPGSVKFNH